MKFNLKTIMLDAHRRRRSHPAVTMSTALHAAWREARANLPAPVVTYTAEELQTLTGLTEQMNRCSVSGVGNARYSELAARAASIRYAARCRA